ncbi:hypothetical protein BU24DRAFT_481114 [Aaosphaeria arxii CBS 175.79]|uniref:Uncharacterized protein n=1 Tax=Aaosphaeria arxii CBS 175.79 TaxID=1450172 RepID=A0A6A5XUX8_9PLEO|nr:uncharacterized protein BU24DRAFT_481114 [Aaosphaeria arxii CBS 175.79]KAF2016511.1 hypothetical protein BU24DRAFT_481114 [Aaosphaeria arxii CBS 175.79]
MDLFNFQHRNNSQGMTNYHIVAFKFKDPMGIEVNGEIAAVALVPTFCSGNKAGWQNWCFYHIEQNEPLVVDCVAREVPDKYDDFIRSMKETWWDEQYLMYASGTRVLLLAEHVALFKELLTNVKPLWDEFAIRLAELPIRVTLFNPNYFGSWVGQVVAKMEQRAFPYVFHWKPLAQIQGLNVRDEIILLDPPQEGEDDGFYTRLANPDALSDFEDDGDMFNY